MPLALLNARKRGVLRDCAQRGGQAAREALRGRARRRGRRYGGLAELRPEEARRANFRDQNALKCSKKHPGHSEMHCTAKFEHPKV